MPNCISCIYCSARIDPSKGEGDHIINAAMGEFEDDIRFRRICQKCNNDIGVSEQVMLQCGPESIIRRKVNPARPSKRRRGRKFMGGAMGSNPPQYTAPFGDYDLLMLPSPTDPNRLETVDQLIVKDANQQLHHIRLYANMRPEQLQRRLDQIEAKPFAEIYLDADPVGWDGHMTLMRAVWPKVKLEEHPRHKFGNEDNAECKIRLAVNVHYFRTIAKMAFHGYLIHNKRGVRGDEPNFAAIRKFIMEGSMPDTEKFCFGETAVTFVEPFGLQKDGRFTTPTNYCHILASDETNPQIVGFVHLFAGPGCQTKTYHVPLGILDTIVCPTTTYVHAHCYQYASPQPEVGNAGIVREMVVELAGNKRLISGHAK